MNSFGLSSGGSGGDLDFSGQSCGPVPVENVRRICLCVDCGRNYCKSPLSMAKVCADCETEDAVRREAMNRPLDIPKALAPEERVDWKPRGRKANPVSKSKRYTRSAYQVAVKTLSEAVQ